MPKILAMICEDLEEFEKLSWQGLKRPRFIRSAHSSTCSTPFSGSHQINSSLAEVLKMNLEAYSRDHLFVRVFIDGLSTLDLGAICPT